jgi:hypothetical protein
MFKKIKLFKKVLELSKGIKRIIEENPNTIYELKQIFEGLKILFPDLKGVLNEIFELVKGDNNKKV